MGMARMLLSFRFINFYLFGRAWATPPWPCPAHMAHVPRAVVGPWSGARRGPRSRLGNGSLRRVRHAPRLSSHVSSVIRSALAGELHGELERKRALRGIALKRTRCCTRLTSNTVQKRWSPRVIRYQGTGAQKRACRIPTTRREEQSNHAARTSRGRCTKCPLCRVPLYSANRTGSFACANLSHSAACTSPRI